MKAQIEELMTIEDVERVLKLPRETVYFYVRKKKIPGFKVGRAWRFDPKDIREFLQKQKNIAKAKKPSKR